LATVHTVGESDHISAIAEQYGFAHFQIIWDDPANAGLRDKRKTPDLLLAGDQITIPDKTLKTVSAGTGQTHTFVISQEKLELRLRVQDLAGRAVAGSPCNLEVEGEASSTATNGDGVVDKRIPRTAKKGKLELDEVAFDIDIGRLDPIDEESGWQARLVNLGYLEKAVGDVRPEYGQLRKRELLAAIEEFQCDRGLPLTGEMDDATQAALSEVHGC
jgi:Putative peptidoglycan binding domain